MPGGIDEDAAILPLDAEVLPDLRNSFIPIAFVTAEAFDDAVVVGTNELRKSGSISVSSGRMAAFSSIPHGMTTSAHTTRCNAFSTSRMLWIPQLLRNSLFGHGVKTASPSLVQVSPSKIRLEPPPRQRPSPPPKSAMATARPNPPNTRVSPIRFPVDNSPLSSMTNQLN